MPHDQVTPVEEPNTPAMIWWKRILQVSADTVPTFIGGILVAILVSIAWNVWTLPDIIEANRKEAEVERARYHAEFKAEQEKSEAALKAERERSDAALKAERERSDARFENMLRLQEEAEKRRDAAFKAERERADAALKAERERSDERFDSLILRLDDTRQDTRRLDDNLRENGNLTIKNTLRIDRLEESGDGES